MRRKDWNLLEEPSACKSFQDGASNSSPHCFFDDCRVLFSDSSSCSLWHRVVKGYSYTCLNHHFPSWLLEAQSPPSFDLFFEIGFEFSILAGIGHPWGQWQTISPYKFSFGSFHHATITSLQSQSALWTASLCSNSKGLSEIWYSFSEMHLVD